MAWRFVLSDHQCAGFEALAGHRARVGAGKFEWGVRGEARAAVVTAHASASTCSTP